jgi:positive regulator of sigma E activity
VEEIKKPSRFFAILFTVAAVCSLMTLLFMIVGGSTSTGLVLLQALTVVLLVIGAVGKWYQYAQTYVKYEVERRLDQEKKE